MIEVKKAEFPYLVDIGVTSICAKKCKYCYASATTDGKYAEPYFLGNILPDVLLASNVFEVVLGGYGEPTLYTGYERGIEYIIQQYKEKNFKVGLTTSNYEWNEASNFKESISNLDSIAVSCNSFEDMGPAISLAKSINECPKLKDNHPVVSIQTIAGILPWKDTMEILSASVKEYIGHITVLGLHHSGRAKKIKGHPLPKNWMYDLKRLNEDHYANIGIDATMVADWGDALIEAGIEEYRLSGSEGRQTCFVDAVNKVIKPSSFSEESYGWGSKNGDFLKIFAGFK